RARAAIGLLVCTLVAGCGGKSGPGTTRPRTTQPPARSVDVYFLRGNALAPVRMPIPRTPAVPTAALQKLLTAPPSGYRSAIPAGTMLQSVAVAGGHATVRFSTDRLTHVAEGQIVYTLTQFPTVTAVDGGPFAAPAARADFADLTPRAAIFVAEPERDGAVS